MMQWKDRWFDDWSKGFDFAQKQAITGIVFEEIERNHSYSASMPEMLLFQWIGTVEQIKHQNHLLDNEVEALATLLDSHSIRYAVVKGQVVASYYEKPEYRQSGDVDFYVQEEDVERAKELICREWGVEMDKGDSPYHYHFEHGGVTFEIHFRLFQWYQKKRELYWQEILHKAMGHSVKIGSTKVATLEPTVHTLYVFMHLYHHLVELGVGLRQFCDLAMMLKVDIDKELLRKHLETLGLERAFRACEYVLKNYLGLDEKYLPYIITDSDKKYGRRMISVVLYRGNMGHYNKRHGWSGLGHQLESACIKITHFVKFFWLSPEYHLGWMAKRLKLIK